MYALSRWINDNALRCGFARPPMPDGVLTKPPSAELRPNQTDQDSLPPYDLLDDVIERHVGGRQSAAHIAAATGYDAQTVARIVRLIDVNEFKRRQAAIGIKVTPPRFSGRSSPCGRRGGCRTASIAGS